MGVFYRLSAILWFELGELCVIVMQICYYFVSVISIRKLIVESVMCMVCEIRDALKKRKRSIDRSWYM